MTSSALGSSTAGSAFDKGSGSAISRVRSTCGRSRGGVASSVFSAGNARTPSAGADGVTKVTSDSACVRVTVGGRNVYPAEIENALAEHPAVLSCLVVGIPHSDLGQVPHALVHAADGHGLDESGVAAFVAERLAEYKVPRSVEFVDTPLRDDAGKARRTAVRDEVIARLSARAPAPEHR